MTLPAKQPDPAEGSGDAQRPDWLRGTDEDLGVVPTSRAPVRKPASKPPPAPERLEGLVGPETPSQAPPPIVEDREIQLGVDRQPGAPSTLSRLFEAIRGGSAQVPPGSQTPPVAGVEPADHPKAEAPALPQAAWTAAASSVPSLKTRRRSDDASVAPSMDEWEEEDGMDSPSRARAASRVPGAASRTRFELDQMLAQLRQLARKGWSALMRLPQPAKIGIAAAVVLIPFTIWLVSPKEHFIRVGKVCANAQQLDGQVVHVRGKVGEVFQVAGGYAFWLMQGRDSIVVFTTYQTPVEKEHIKIAGTVSTGFLDGKARAAIFENPATK